MTDRPIRVRGPMIRALLDGSKTQDRQVLRPWPGYQASWLSPETLHKSPWCYLCEVDGRLGAQMAHPLAGRIIDGIRIEDDSPLSWVRLPYTPGDRLWVREAHAMVPRTAYQMSEGVEQAIKPSDDYYAAIYREGWTRSKPGPWKSSTQMPRWASRITLNVTDVRVQRLQDINAEDAQAEGCLDQVNTHCGSLVNCYGPDCPTDPAMSCNQHGCWGIREDFRDLWNSLHGDDAWSLNPWVAAITFTVHKGNIDQVSA